MKLPLTLLIVFVSLHTAAAAANAQFSIPWSTIDGGGGSSVGGSFEVAGTIGQADASGSLASGTLGLTGGFWAVADAVPACPADFNNSGGVSVQDIFDFLNAFFLNHSSADFNGSGTVSVQDIFDFLAAYFTGCD